MGSGLRFDAIEVFEENGGEVCAVGFPVGGGGIVFEAGDPVAVEFVDGGIDAVALEPTFAEGAAVFEIAAGGAFGEPGVFAEKLFEDFHALKISVKIRDGRAADVEFAVAVVVEFEGEMRFLADQDHVLEPFFEGGVFGGEIGIGEFVPIAVEIFAAHVEASAAEGDTVFVGHRQDVNGVAIEERRAVRFEEVVDEPFDDPVAAGFPRVGAGAEEDAIGCVGFAEANDFEFAAEGGFADGRDLDEGIGADGIEEAVEVGEAVRLDARDIKEAARHLEMELDAVGGKGLGGDGFPGVAVLRNDHGFEFAGDGAGGGIPDIVEVEEFEGEIGAGIGFDAEMDVAGGAVGGIAFEVVEEVDLDDAVGGEVVPDGRSVFDGGIDEVEGMGADQRTRENEEHEEDEACAHGIRDYLN